MCMGRARHTRQAGSHAAATSAPGCGGLGPPGGLPVRWLVCASIITRWLRGGDVVVVAACVGLVTCCVSGCIIGCVVALWWWWRLVLLGHLLCLWLYRWLLVVDRLASRQIAACQSSCGCGGRWRILYSLNSLLLSGVPACRCVHHAYWRCTAHCLGAADVS